MAPAKSPHEPLKIGIIGSCVSRDTVELAMQETARCTKYIARQSIISFDHPASKSLKPSIDLQSEYRQRNFDADWAGNGIDEIIQAKDDIDLLVWDIVDERYGVLESPDGGFITTTYEGISAGAYNQLEGWRAIEFGTEEHFELFCKATEHLVARLKEAGILDRLVFVWSLWAEKDSDGTKTPMSGKNYADQMNLLSVRYELFIASLGIPVLHADPQTLVSDPNHKWGLAPFHYVQGYYDSLATALINHSQKDATDDAK